MDDEMMVSGVVCGRCGGPFYMETCENQGGPAGHTWALAGECKNCGERHMFDASCPDCGPAANTALDVPAADTATEDTDG